MQKQFKPVIAIIDSGMSSLNNCLKKDLFINYLGNDFCFCNGQTDEEGHGTTINKIIRWHNEDATLINIKLLQQDEVIMINDLIAALQYVYDNIDCNIINISMSYNVIEDFSLKRNLEDICNRLANKNMIIVAAFDNLGSISYPAAFKSVIGVTSGEYCKRNNDVEYVYNDIVNICGKGNNQIISINKDRVNLVSGNSLACAHVSGIISTILNENDNTDCILKKLERMAIFKHDFLNNGIKNNNPTPIYKKAIVLPFNKEIHSLIRHSDLLSFKIIDVFDFKYFGTVGQSTNKLLCSDSKDYIIKDFSEIDYNKFDTVILGHTNEIRKISKINSYLNEIINRCNKLKKNIYSFDDILPSDNTNIFVPRLSKKDIHIAPFGKLYRISKPVLGIWGTSSRQGKFTLQLLLRKRLINDHYIVGQIGSEPTAYLFGFDDCFHFGYDSNCEIKRFDMISYINKSMHDIEEKDVDLIIVGCQSRTLPVDNGNLNNFPLAQTEFIFSVQPDFIILMINSWDDEIYIQKTIDFIESSTFAKVIALVLSPWMLVENFNENYYKKELLNTGDYIKIKNKLIDVFKLPVGKIDDEDSIEQIYNCLVNNLTDETIF